MQTRSNEPNSTDRAILREVEKIAEQYREAGMTVPGRTLETIAVCRWRAGITTATEYRAEVIAARKAHAAELRHLAAESRAKARYHGSETRAAEHLKRAEHYERAADKLTQAHVSLFAEP